ncbi:MAG: TIGR03086 family metal-binding protein [Acidimicrobiia bacterium]
MSDVADRYERLGREFAATIAAVPADRWEEPSPCAGWTARDVVTHVCATQSLFLGLIGVDAAEGPDVAQDPLGAWRAASAPVAAALADPDRAGRVYEGVFGPTTFESAVDRFANFDLIVHRWDLARATGGDETISEADAQRVLDGAEAFGPALRSDGVCGAAVDVPADADLATRALAIVGRRV